MTQGAAPERRELTFAEKIKTLNFGLPSRRGPKRTVSSDGKVTATVTEHWNDRQDVNIDVAPVRVEGS